MATTTMYTCDVCKQSKSKDDLAHLNVEARDGIQIKGYGYYGLKIDICKDCLKKKGFIVDPPENEKEKIEISNVNTKTLEDKIFDILEDLGVAFQE